MPPVRPSLTNRDWAIAARTQVLTRRADWILEPFSLSATGKRNLLR
jgi:hypothetical protein